MAYVWQTGDFATGATSPDKQFTHMEGSASITVDVKCNQVGVVKFHKDIVPDWRQFRRIDTMLICHDDSRAWNDPKAILFAGFLNAVPSEFGETITLSASGLKEWWALHVINRTYNGVVTDPEAEIKFTGDTDQNLMHNIIVDAHSTAGIPSDISRRPPQVLGSVSGSGATGIIEYAVKISSYMTYLDAVEDMRDIASSDGNEFYIYPVWANPEKTIVKFNVVIGGDDTQHINFNYDKDIYLERNADLLGTIDPNKDYDFFGLRLDQSGENYFNRIIGQSKAGEAGATNADLTTKIINAGPTVLVDGTYNPNVELSQAQLNAQIDKRLETATKYPLTGTAKISGNPVVWLGHLGKKARLIETTGFGDPITGYGRSEVMRITDMKISPDENTISVGFLSPATRYPKLPREVVKPGTQGPKSTTRPITPAGSGNAVHTERGTKPEENTNDGWPKTPGNKEKWTDKALYDKGVFVEEAGWTNKKMVQEMKVWGDEGATKAAQYGATWRGPEGVTVIPSKIQKRFFGASWIATVTSYDQNKPRLEPYPLEIYKSFQFNKFPTVTKTGTNPYFPYNDIYAYDAGNDGTTGGKIGEITTDMIKSQMLSDASPAEYQAGHPLQFERFASGILIQGAEGNQSIIAYFHQLQVFTGFKDPITQGSNFDKTWVQSHSFAFKASIGADGELTSGWTAIDSPFELNGTDKEKFTVYATPLSVESYGNLNQYAIMTTPSYYPKKFEFNANYYTTSSIGAFWKKLNFGKISVTPASIVHNFINNRTVIGKAPQADFFQVAYAANKDWWSFDAAINFWYDTRSWDQLIAGEWVSPWQIRVYNNEFWAVSLSYETHFAGRNQTQFGNPIPAYMRFFAKSKMGADGTPIEWIFLSISYASTPFIDNNNGTGEDQPVAIWPMVGYKDIMQVGGWMPTGVFEDTMTPPPDWDGGGMTLGGATGINASRFLYNSKNNPKTVFDDKYVSYQHVQYQGYSYNRIFHSFLDFDGFSMAEADNSLNGEGQIYNWKDCGEYILPVWNIGYNGSHSAWHDSPGTHNGKFLELDNMVVSQAPTVSYLTKFTTEENPYDSVYTWKWRK